MTVYASTLEPFFSGRIAGTKNGWRGFSWAIGAITGGIPVATFLMLPEHLEEPTDGQETIRLSDVGLKEKEGWEISKALFSGGQKLWETSIYPPSLELF